MAGMKECLGGMMKKGTLGPYTKKVKAKTSKK